MNFLAYSFQSHASCRVAVDFDDALMQVVWLYHELEHVCTIALTCIFLTSQIYITWPRTPVSLLILQWVYSLARARNVCIIDFNFVFVQ